MQNSLSDQIHQFAVWGLPIKSYECWNFFFTSHLRAFCRSKCCFFAAKTHKVGLILWGLLEGILCSGPETLATQSLWFFFSYSREATGAQVPGRLNYTNFASHQEHKFETKKHNLFARCAWKARHPF